MIGQLRNGAAFAAVAAQFSQSQTALQGGDLGWVQTNQVDPAVLRVLQEMPVGAVSNPIRVPGGMTIVTLRAKREVGQDNATIATVQQVFVLFPTRSWTLEHPTDQQRWWRWNRRTVSQIRRRIARPWLRLPRCSERHLHQR